ncbi:MAG: hypothetical protein J7K84_07485 [Deltaproteobacteria bacterium]|nr:hypothetical protein [Deltaproteobacteria bacterium]
MNTTYNESSDVAIEKDKWERTDTAKRIFAFETREETISQRAFAKKTNVP